jgi:hypothetical protein
VLDSGGEARDGRVDLRLGGGAADGHDHSELDCRRQRKAPAVVGVLADEVDPAGAQTRTAQACQHRCR